MTSIHSYMETVIQSLVREIVDNVARVANTPEAVGGRMPVKTGNLSRSMLTSVYKQGNQTVGEVTFTAPYAGLLNKGGTVRRTYRTKDGRVDKEVEHTPKAFLDGAVAEEVDMEKINEYLQKHLKAAQNIDIKAAG